jgi:flagellin
MLSIVTNPESLTAQKNLSRTGRALSANFGRLSSGLRINSAGDDAAGLAISEKLKAQIRSVGQAERNANDGISLLQTAEGAMGELGGILTRMRELAAQAATGTVGPTERGFLSQEFEQLRDEIDRVATVTEFNGTKLLDGTATSAILTFQVGIGATSSDRLSLGIVTVDSTALGLAAESVSTISTAQSSLGIIDSAITLLSAARADIGAVQNRMQVTIMNLQSARENLSAANSRIRDVDVADETAKLTKNNILMQAGVSVLAQANQAPSLALSLLK